MTDNDGAFMRRLVTVFSDLEDLEDEEGLAKVSPPCPLCPGPTTHLPISSFPPQMADICRFMLLLDDGEILDRVVIREADFVNVAGVMEYDPALKTRADHREFLTRWGPAAGSVR